MTARALTQLGEVALFGGRPVDARRFFDESLPIWRGYFLAVSMTPAAEALMTAETPPDWA